jgi:hypothetical protein
MYSNPKAGAVSEYQEMILAIASTVLRFSRDPTVDGRLDACFIRTVNTYDCCSNPRGGAAAS